jgi:hypothetical protein
MRVYLGKQANVSSADVTPTLGTLLELVWKVKGVGQKIFMDSYFTSPKLFSDLYHRKINACGTVHYNRKEMPPDFSPEHLWLKRGDIRVQGNLRAVCWRNKREVYALSNIHI